MSDQAPREQAPSGERSGLSGVQVAAAVVGVVIVAFIVLLATRDVHQNERSDAPIGEAVPNVAGVSYDGSTFDLEEVLAANRLLPPDEQVWVVVNFFASWCIPCQTEHPELIRFDTEGMACPTRLVGVSIRDSPERVAEFFEQRGGDWPVLVGDTNSIIIDFSVTAPPETVIVTPSGIVGAKFIGAVTYEQLVDAIPC